MPTTRCLTPANVLRSIPGFKQPDPLPSACILPKPTKDWQKARPFIIFFRTWAAPLLRRHLLQLCVWSGRRPMVATCANEASHHGGKRGLIIRVYLHRRQKSLWESFMCACVCARSLQRCPHVGTAILMFFKLAFVAPNLYGFSGPKGSLLSRTSEAL